jgi:hypothetical protein
MVPHPAPRNQKPHNNGMSCPYCSSMECQRSMRHGWRDFICQLLRMFPWRCNVCKNRFYLHKRSLLS